MRGPRDTGSRWRMAVCAVGRHVSVRAGGGASIRVVVAVVMGTRSVDVVGSLVVSGRRRSWAVGLVSELGAGTVTGVGEGRL